MKLVDSWRRRRLGLLEAIVYAAPCRLCAVIGPGNGPELLAIARAARRPRPPRKGDPADPADSVICFHSRPRRARAAENCLTEYDKRQRRHQRRAEGPTPVADAVRFVEATGDDRAEWRAEARRLIHGKAKFFGLVVHLRGGTLSQVRDDLDALGPATGLHPKIVLCRAHAFLSKGRNAGPYGVFECLKKDPRWGGVWWRDYGIAVMDYLEGWCWLHNLAGPYPPSGDERDLCDLWRRDVRPGDG